MTSSSVWSLRAMASRMSTTSEPKSATVRMPLRRGAICSAARLSESSLYSKVAEKRTSS